MQKPIYNKNISAIDCIHISKMSRALPRRPMRGAESLWLSRNIQKGRGVVPALPLMPGRAPSVLALSLIASLGTATLV